MQIEGSLVYYISYGEIYLSICSSIPWYLCDIVNFKIFVRSIPCVYVYS